MSQQPHSSKIARFLKDFAKVRRIVRVLVYALFTSQMNQDQKLWKPEDWYPPLCPPETLKEDLLQNEDFTEVDKDARAKLDSPKDSFDKLVHHLTSHLSSDLHKLRAIFVWMGAQNIGCRQQGGNCEDSNSPEYYLENAPKSSRFIDKMFARMCRVARIACVLVNGKAKCVLYEPGDVDIEGENTWAVVYVADSWRFVFPHWAFVKVHGYQKENLVLVEDTGKPALCGEISDWTIVTLTGDAGTHPVASYNTKAAIGGSYIRIFTCYRDDIKVGASCTRASVGTKRPDFDEIYFLTDPEEMNYLCHPYDEEKQLLSEPWTQEKFFVSPFFSNSYFSSKWKLISPLTCVIKSTSGWCLIDMFSPEAGYKLNYKMSFDEGHSGKKFAQEIQTDRYVTITKRTQQTESFLVRLPVTGTYKFELIGIHGGRTTKLAKFRIVCDNTSPETQPFPSQPENGFGFGEAAAEAGLSEPSHTEGIVPVKSGDKIYIHFKVKEDVDILASLVHSTKTPEELRDNVSVHRENNNATVMAKLPADDPTPEYSLKVDIMKNRKENDESIKTLFIYNVLNYLLTSDERLNAVITDKDEKDNLQYHEDAWVSVGKDDAGMLKAVASNVKRAGIKDPMLDKKIRTREACYKRMLEEMLASARDRDLDRLNRTLKICIAANLQNREEIEDSKKILMALCEEEMEKAVKSRNLEELRRCVNKIDNICVAKAAREQSWFEEVQEEIKRMVQSLRNKDEATVGKPPDHVIDVIVAAFILIGESEGELNTWQKVAAKLKETNEEQLRDEVNSLDCSLLTRGRVDLAAQKLDGADGTFADYRSTETLKTMCLEKINFYRTRGSLKRRN